MNKFKYTLFPKETYLVTFDDHAGQQSTIEVSGEDIVNALRKGYALEKTIEDIDKVVHEG